MLSENEIICAEWTIFLHQMEKVVVGLLEGGGLDVMIGYVSF